MRLYEVQKNYPTPGDLIGLVKKDLKTIGEPFGKDKIVSMNTLKIKNTYTKKIEQVVFLDLKRIQMIHSKKMHTFQNTALLESRDINEEMKGLLFTLRSCMG